MTEDVPDLGSYFQEVGRFINKYSAIKMEVKRLLHKEANVEENIGKITFSNTQIDNAKTYITKLRKLRRAPADPGLTRTFAQLTVITTLRNAMLHYGAQSKGKELFIVKPLTKDGVEESIIFPISGDILNQATTDLSTIHISLFVYTIKLFLEKSGSTLDAGAVQVQSHWKLLSDAPWQCRPPQQPQK